MASPVDICNLALSHLGARAQITSISPPDNSVEAGYCARFFPMARKEALESAKWSWTKRRVALAAVTNPSDVWLYAYALPSDCLTPMRILQAAFISAAWWGAPSAPVTFDDIAVFNEAGTAQFEIEGEILLTNEPEAVLLYTRDIVDATKYTASFTTFLSYVLASYLAGPILKGDVGAKTAGTWRQIAAQTKGEAAVHDANSSVDRVDHVPEHLRRR
jgi:hypothetical protein